MKDSVYWVSTTIKLIASVRNTLENSHSLPVTAIPAVWRGVGALTLGKSTRELLYLRPGVRGDPIFQVNSYPENSWGR